jgi:hypothetical protein
MSENISKSEFCKVYVPMAVAGKTALEIAQALGIDKGDNKKSAAFVSQKASNYRAELKKVKGMTEEKADELMPPLKHRTTTNSGQDFVDFLAGLAESTAPEGDEAPLLVNENGVEESVAAETSEPHPEETPE